MPNKSVILLPIFLGLIILMFVGKTFVDNAEKNSANRELHSFISHLGLLIEKADTNELERHVTETPNAYIEDYYEAVRTSKKMSKDEFQRLQEKGSTNFTVEPFRRNFNDKRDLVKYVFPNLSSIKNQNLKFQNATEITQNGEEARAALRFTRNNSPDQFFEILLYRVNDQWKVFGFESKDQISLYKVQYGKPN